MKILYVKNNSERAKQFQLKTVIYEVAGKTFIKKEALTVEAIEHLHALKNNYNALKKSIIDTRIKLAPIIEENSISLTFEFIEGESLEKRFIRSLKNNTYKQVIDDYCDIVENGFKTTLYDNSMSKEYISYFGENDYTVLADQLCFDGISNIDLIFSNIIYNKNNDIYIIDYEWVVCGNIPLEYVKYRAIGNLLHNYKHKFSYKDLEKDFLIGKSLYHTMTEFFYQNYVCKNAFYSYKRRYLKKKYQWQEMLSYQEQQIQQKELYIQQKDQQIQQKEQQIQNLNQTVAELHELAQSMRIKNRIKKILGLYK